MRNFSLDNLTSLLIMFEDNGRANLPRRNTMKAKHMEENFNSNRADIPIKKSYSSARLNASNPSTVKLEK